MWCVQGQLIVCVGGGGGIVFGWDVVVPYHYRTMSCHSVQTTCRSGTLECVVTGRRRVMSAYRMPLKDASQCYSNGYRHEMINLFSIIVLRPSRRVQYVDWLVLFSSATNVYAV